MPTIPSSRPQTWYQNTTVEACERLKSKLSPLRDRGMSAAQVLTERVLDGSHAKRVTIMPCDMQLARRIRGERN